MTPTPRTDEAADRFPQPGQPPGAQWPEIVPAEFARQLERELAAKDAHADEIYKASVNLAAKLEDDLAELTQSLAFQTQLNREVIEREKQTFADLAAERAEHEETTSGARMLVDAYSAERALADRLAETLANVQGDYATTGAITTQEVAESLAAWKEARRGTA